MNQGTRIMPRRRLTDAEKQRSREKRLETKRKHMRLNRTNESYRLKEVEYDRLRRKRSCSNEASTSESPEAKKQKHLEKNKLLHQTYREDEKYRLKENRSKRLKRKRAKFESNSVPSRAYDLNSETETPEFQRLSERFRTSISEGPTHVCYCCDRLWFRNSIRSSNKSWFKSKGATDEFISFVFYIDNGDEGKFCQTCYDSLRKLRIPKLAANNGFIFPEIPDCLKDLNPLEERLVSARLPFMQIRPLGVDKQYGIKGTVVNVPIDLDTTVNSLPRNLDDQYTIHVKLKKRLTFKSDYMYAIINPDRVFRAASYLKQQELYKELNVNLNLDWYDRVKRQDFNMENCIKECETDIEENEEFELNPGSTHTLISGCGDQGLSIAPGENRTPVSLLFDDFAEELSFPTIYCGIARHFQSNPTLLQIANSEIRRSDRRAATPYHLLYIYCRYIHRRILNAMGISLRKKKTVFERKITAANLLDESFVDDLITHNEGYKFLRSIKSAPAHWETEKYRLFAAIRQFGVATLFLTVSAAETHWYDLMNSLSMNIDKKGITEEEFEIMPYDQKCRLIQSDPVTCALHFDYRLRELKKTWSSKDGPFASYPIMHSYHRIEFQHRGSPHAHMLLWLKNAPIYSPENAEECEKFIDELMTCSQFNPFVEYQRHKHSFTCKRQKRNGDVYCRFNMPFFPMDETRILEPFAEEDDRRSELNYKYDELVEYLANLNDSYLSFDDFLNNLNLSLSQYLNIIKCGINKPTIVLKRDVNEIMINNYNPKVINLMQSNMDIQYILNGYACVAYMVDYINKSQRGMSKLLKKCIEETKNGNLCIRDSLAAVANQFINATEISAQEAAWSILELPMSRMSENDIFIPTFPPRDRARIVKSQEQLKNLPKDSEDIYELSILDRYVLRPRSLENMCLADFGTKYEFIPPRNDEMTLLDNSLSIRQRKKRKILRCVGYKEHVDKTQYYREQIMLYSSWRDEKNDILDRNIEVEFMAKKDEIEENRKAFNKLEFDIESITLEFEDENDIAELTQDIGEQEREIELDYDEDELKPNINLDMEEYVGREFDLFRIQNRLPDDEYSSLIRKANNGQYDILKHIMYLTYMTSEPYHIFITGPAGSGKSYTIHAITETVNRLLNKRGSDPSAIRILKLAPTGKAAYNISGLTLHSAFAIPTKVGKDMLELSPAKVNEYRAQYRNLQVIIIDEISMVGFNLFRRMDQRLRQIMDLDKPFGGLSVIAFGDFRQLPPVRDTPVYQIPKNSGINQLSGNFLWNNFQHYELTDIMRQKDDLLFAHCLNNMANGTMTQEDIQLIESRIIGNPNTVPNEAIQLFYSNKEVDEYNAKKVLKLDTEEFMAEALDYVHGIGSKSSKTYLRRKLKSMNKNDTGNLSYKLQLKIDARYMLISNVKTSDGLVNGAMGILKKIEYCGIIGSDEKAVKRLWIDFESDNIGKMTRKEVVTYALKNKISLSYTPIDRIKATIGGTNKRSALSATRQQFPIQIAEAITIHKSQGATYNSCAVNTQPTMNASLLYVACSRATSANGLHIIGNFKPPTKSPEDRVTKELNRLKANQLVPVYRFLRERDDFRGIQFMYHNIQSLPAHYEDMMADPCFMQSDLILLAETWTLPSDNFIIPGFELVERVDGHCVRSHSGLHIYVNNRLKGRCIKSWNFDDNGLQMAVVHILNKFQFAVVYANPRMSNDDKVYEITQGLGYACDNKTILVGDFNVNFDTPEGQEFADELLIKNLRLRTNPKHHTTRGGTTIDAIFSNHSMRTGVYMSTYSYHMPLYGRIDYTKDPES